MTRTTVAVNGRTAFISGAASGIGRAVALRLAAHGCPLALVDQDETGLAETAALVGVPVLTRTLDVRDREAQAGFAAEVAAWAPAPLGMVFNNAGVTIAQSVAGATVADDDWVLGINFGGVANGVRAFLPILLAQDSGVIVNTSSAFGLVGFPEHGAYCASKFAVRGYTEALRQELRDTGVRAVTVYPGGVRTNIALNARYPDGGGSRAQAAREFDARAATTAERAAELIHDGVTSGRSRILVGPDAHAVDVLSRLAPNRYFDVLLLLLRLKSRRR